MQSTYDKGCDVLADESGATDICAHCASDGKLQPALYFCFQCGTFGRYMCGDCNKQHRKFAWKHDARRLSTAAQQPRKTTEKGCNEITDESRNTIICAHCAFENNIKQAGYFCFQCGPYGRYMCEICNKQHNKFAFEHHVRILSKETKTLTPSIPLVQSGWMNKGYPVVAAIVLENSYSTYAFSTLNSFHHDPSKVTMPLLHRDIFFDTKLPTCVLFDNNKKFHSFGNDAEENYLEYSQDGEQGNYYFFRGFKRRFPNNMERNRNYMLEDETGKQMDALDVFSASIRFLRDHFMKVFRKEVYDITDEHIRWVITVPAISDDAYKLFMRESAQKAGINGEHLLIAKEDDAASLFCRYQSDVNLTGLYGRYKLFAPKSKYLILDARKDTIDINVYEVNIDGAFKALHNANYGNLGYSCIERAFREFLALIFGNEVMDTLQATELVAYTELFHFFKKKMQSFCYEKNWRIRLPTDVCASGQSNEKTINEHIKTMPEYNGKVNFHRHYIISVQPDIVVGWFKETCDSVKSLIKSVFSKPEFQDVPFILMVGEFSDFYMLQDAIKKTFPNKRIIIPNDAGSAVIKGAVILGHVW